jgi:phage shock protein E
MKLHNLITTVAFCATLGLNSCTSSAQSPQNEATTTTATSAATPFSNIDATTFKTLSEQEAGIILDVRTPSEVAAGKIPQAITIDFMAEGFAEKATALDKAQPVYIYCASGGRSGRAMDLMKGLGFTKVYNLDGGFRAWSQKGYPKE